MATCVCREFLQHPFVTVDDALMGNKYDAVIVNAEQIARSEEKWMSLYRCRVCGTLWAEGCYDRGQVYFYYLFPAPPTDDPIRWLNEEAAELPMA
jgi:uncharacterized CHY-type Zn-finger protein